MNPREKQGGYQDWAHLRAHAITVFNGEAPHPHTEQAIIDAYEQHPDAVARAVDAVAADLLAGKIRSGWGILHKRAESIASPPSNPTAPAGREREKLTQRAEQWIRNAGLHMPTWTEARDELFNERGLLHPWRTDPQLTQRMNDLYNQQRHIGEQIDREETERAENWKRTRAAVLATRSAQLEPQPAVFTDDDFPPP